MKKLILRQPTNDLSPQLNLYINKGFWGLFPSYQKDTREGGERFINAPWGKLIIIIFINNAPPIKAIKRDRDTPNG